MSGPFFGEYAFSKIVPCSRGDMRPTCLPMCCRRLDFLLLFTSTMFHYLRRAERRDQICIGGNPSAFTPVWGVEYAYKRNGLGISDKANFEGV